MTSPIQSRPTPWNTVILVCGKCSRKLDGGFGHQGKDSFRTALKTELKAQGSGRGIRVVETKCFGLCPKKAVVALNAGTPGRIFQITKNTAMNEILQTLL